MLVEETLFGTVDKVAKSIERLKYYEPKEGYFLAFSGGKDSVVIKALADMAGVKYDAHFNLTSVDPPEVIKFTKKHHPDVIFEKPERTMWQLIVAKQFMPLRRLRYCCKELKEGNGAGRTIITGIRWAESVRRSKRMMFEICRADKTKTFLHPIIDWSTDDVWQFIRERNIPYCSLYDEGCTRIGCILCCMQTKKKKLADIERYPLYAERYKRASQKAWDLRIGRGLESKHGLTHEEYWNWWITNDDNKDDESQCTLFEE